MADRFCAVMASASCDPCEADILEARQHDERVVGEFYIAVTDDDELDVAAHSTGDESDGGASGSADG